MAYIRSMPLVADLSLELVRHVMLEPPAIVRPAYVGSGSKIDDPTDLTWLRDKEHAVDAWIARGKAVREKIWSDAGREPWGESEVEAVDKIISVIDERSVLFADDLREAKKYVEKDRRAAKKHLPPAHYAALMHRCTEAMRISSKQIEDQYLMATFFRALRAEYGPKEGVAIQVDTASDLDAYFADVLKA